MESQKKRSTPEEKAYLQGKEDMRRRIRGVIQLDLLLLQSQSPEEFVKRALQMIDNPDL
jgi:hypothetical protein